jgi:transaldolase/glucose-6-phosphate isomerase
MSDTTAQMDRAPAASGQGGNPLKQLNQFGQSPWLDNVNRADLSKGVIEKMIQEDGLKGVTSNPAIFEKAMGGSDVYDDQLKSLLSAGAKSVGDLYEAMAITDIQSVADKLKPVYEATKYVDGYVSLEVSPYLANDTEATLNEARRLWKAVDRKNLMVKVPATKAGIPAIETLIGEGININVTLLFAQSEYKAVAEAYIRGVKKLAASGGDVSRIASVASFFVSRIDTLVDQMIDEAVKADGSKADMLGKIKGEVAIANARQAYQLYKQLFGTPEWKELAGKGAHVQRLLWASTSMKNKAYSDVRYVEELIGPETVDTIPPATMDAFRDHGKPRASMEENLDGAKKVMETLKAGGISIDQATTKLVEQGVQLFADAFDQLLGAVEKKRVAFLGDRLNRMECDLGADLDAAVKDTVTSWLKSGKMRKLWAQDASVWTGADEAKWLGWLNIVDEQLAKIDVLKQLRERCKGGEFSHVLLLGMGGSSLGPEVLAETFGRQAGWPELLVLDSTDPQQIKTFEGKIDLAKTLFVVSSKSGSTLEPNIFKQYFFERAKSVLGDKTGDHFIAVTDPGSNMQKVAEGDRFSGIYYGLKTIGGRYSVLSDFGMAPGAAMGLDVEKFLSSTSEMVRACSPTVPASENPGFMLGAILGTAGVRGRDKVTIVASPKLYDFGAWAEQLIAESTGKIGKGLIPVDLETLGDPSVYGNDRVFVHLHVNGEGGADAGEDSKLDALAKAGHPVVRIELASPATLGQEFFRWEIAIAVAGSIIGINPFDQPDVEASKIKTKELTSAYESSGSLPAEAPFYEEGGIKLFSDEENTRALQAKAGEKTLKGYLKAHLDTLKPNDYAAFLAYIERDKAHIDAVQAIRMKVRDARKVATVLGFGPRFLHSTGQAYKGGPNSGVFLQITADDKADLAVPGQTYTFGVVKAAQARGDFGVLAERKRRALRIHLPADVDAGLKTLSAIIASIA